MSSSLLRRHRVYRAVLALLAAANLATVALDALDGHPGVLVFNVAICAFLIVLVAARTTAIRRLEEEAKPKPDYAAIARMEQEHYGRTFKHDGAPEHPPIGTTICKTCSNIRWIQDPRYSAGQIWRKCPKCNDGPRKRRDGLCSVCCVPLGTGVRYHDILGHHYCEACERKRRRP